MVYAARLLGARVTPGHEFTRVIPLSVGYASLALQPSRSRRALNGGEGILGTIGIFAGNFAPHGWVSGWTSRRGPFFVIKPCRYEVVLGFSGLFTVEIQSALMHPQQEVTAPYAVAAVVLTTPITPVLCVLVVWYCRGNDCNSCSFATQALCEGQLLQISQHTAVFSLLGTTYGGDGRHVKCRLLMAFIEPLPSPLFPLRPPFPLSPSPCFDARTQNALPQS